ncbi:hypothetical protein PtB15_10B590 [Puccinia triticina]|nr:hypothetical protein PtB15_10B590 [Puccinia triticina]
MNTDGSAARLQPGTRVQVGKYVVQVDQFLSEGGFAHVYVVSLLAPASVPGFPPAQNRFVLKRMAVPDKPALGEVRREVDVMKQLRPHKHIVCFIEASASSIPHTPAYEIFILMEWCPGGGIIDLLNSRLQNRLTESEILKIFSDTVAAVAHMHSQNPVLIHRDLKVENILLAAPNLYKLCDFGSTTTPAPRPPQSSAEIRALEADLNKHTTLQYRAPEMVDVWSRKGVTEKADIWALGVFLYKLCYYTTPFEANGPLAIVNVQYQIPSYPAYSNSIKYLIGTMLQELPQSRPDIWEVHDHVCRLRGVPPHLRRPSRKQSLSHIPPQLSVLPEPATNTLDAPDGLDSIFSAAPPSAAVSTKEADAVVPMRRGRPAVKSKPGLNNGEPFFNPVHQPAPAATTGFPAKKHSPPEESDLFAREAAAGFGDAFLSSPSPQITAFKPVAGAAQRPALGGNPSPSLSGSRSHMSLKPSAAAPTPMVRRDSKPATSSAAFEDLVPLIKKPTPKTLNEMRSGLGLVASTSTGPSMASGKSKVSANSFTSKPGLLPQEPTSMSISSGTLSQKTGPQTLPSSRIHEPTSGYRKISITQRTGPAVSSKPSLSEWLRKDQPALSTSDHQAGGEALARRQHQASSVLPQNNVSRGDQRNPLEKSPSSSGSSDEQQAPEDAAGRSVYRGPPGPPARKPSLKASSWGTSPGGDPAQIGGSSATASDGKTDGLGRKPSLKPASWENSAADPAQSAGPSSASGGHIIPTRKPSLKSSSWENSAGDPALAASGGQINPTRKPSLKPSSWENSVADPVQTGGPSPASGGKISLAAEAPQTSGAGPASPPSSADELSSSEAMTEEDEEVRLRRRAAIAKFAPAAAVGPPGPSSASSDRDPFSSRAGSRPVGPAPAPAEKPAAARRTVGPPLRAPKPQSLKSQAAITSLVSRYETLGLSAPGGSELATSEASLPAPAGRRLSSFKPNPSAVPPAEKAPRLAADKDAGAAKTNPPIPPRHIPLNALGPGLPATRPRDVFPDAADVEPIFTSVNDLKSKWESGAVRPAAPAARPPRTDYGQT